MQRLFLLFALLIFCVTSAYAEEAWLCDGFAHSDGSTSAPFILKGDGQTLEFRLEVDHILEHVASNEIVGYEIFVSSSDTTARRAYYVREDGNQLEIQQHGWNFSQSASTCYRQR